MKVAIMQPYFFPYIGYFSLIKHSDLFILLDAVQFMRHGWIERNRILKQDQDWLYIQAPLQKNGQQTLIKDCVIDNAKPWKDKILSQCQIYKKKAPYYKQVHALLLEIFAESFADITSFNLFALRKVSDYLGIQHDIKVFSELNLQIQQVEHPDEWALHICQKLGQDITYINPIGGMTFFDRSKYLNKQVNLFFQKMTLTPYAQGRAQFEPGLSIIDVMMYNEPATVNKMLDQFELI